MSVGHNDEIYPYRVDGARLQILDNNNPVSGVSEVISFAHFLYPMLKMDVFSQTKVFGIHVQILFEEFIVHEVGEFFRNREVTVACHRLAGVDTAGFVQAGIAVSGCIMIVPDPT